MTIRHLLPVVILAMLGLSSTGMAQGPAPYGITISYYVNPDGRGGMIANPTRGGSVSWQACPPGGACAPAASSPTLERALDVGYAAVGTVFVATAVNGSETASASSLPYLGPARPTTPPTISGKLQVGALVKPVAGTWSGGWGREISIRQTQVCKFANGTGCVVVADQPYWDECPGAGAVLTLNHAGRYVRVVERRVDREAAFTMNKVLSPARIVPLQPGPGHAATIAGPIAPGSGPPESTCGGPFPNVALAARAIRRRDRLELGRVTCVLTCWVRVDLKQKGRRALSFKRRFSGGATPGRLLVPYRLTPRMRPGTVNVTVLRDIEIISEGRVRVPRSLDAARRALRAES